MGDLLRDAFGSAMVSVIELYLPLLPWFIGVALLFTAIRMPMPGRGPRTRRRDIWRLFKHAPRWAALERAGGRCESAAFIAWGRCRHAADEIDHVYPWSRGGATVLSNAQALCAGHNRSKSSMIPPWWYLLALERRRRAYFPLGSSVTVHAAMTSEDAAARENWSRNRLSHGAPRR